MATLDCKCKVIGRQIPEYDNVWKHRETDAWDTALLDICEIMYCSGKQQAVWRPGV